VRILHEEEEGAFARASGLVKPLDWMPATHAVEFVKHVHNAFTDTGLDRWLRANGITRLIISGIRTEQCCETTARVASDLGYEVDFVGDATLTFPMTARSGREFSAAEIRERTELVLRDRFARIATVDEALAGSS
jgi:nicotinamidase-related amidase